MQYIGNFEEKKEAASPNVSQSEKPAMGAIFRARSSGILRKLGIPNIPQAVDRETNFHLIEWRISFRLFR